jgi:glycosyltransferase involved in cell wall biosynthesis
MKQLYMAGVEKSLISRAAAIITDSEYSRRDIIKHLTVDSAKVEVVYLTVPDDEQPPDTASLPFPYILDVSSSVIHKNLKTLLAAYAIAKRGRPELPKLVIAGAIPDEAAWGMHPRGELEDEARSLGIENDLVIIQYPPRDRLLALFRDARLFVFPSLFEGFGLAPLEAMKYGVPVILSDRASLPEVGGDAVVYVNPEDPEDIARAIEQVLSHEELRQGLIERGLCRAEWFGDWKRVARQTLAVYQSAAAAQSAEVPQRVEADELLR